MAPLADEVLRILEAERDYPPLSADALARVMFTASGMVVTVGEVDAALDALLIAGKVEAMNSARLGRRWRVLRNRPGVDLSAPPAP